MANIVTQQILVDGPRNTVVKIVGILDTSDVAATGTLGTGASGATTTGSTTITFTAGGLTPVVGQYVTGTGIPSGTYIVSFTATSAVISNAATATNSGLTFTLTAGAIVAVDPAVLEYLDPAHQFRASTVRIDRILYTVEEGLDVRLQWDATTPVYIIDLVKAGHQELKKFGGYQNNAGAGKTGRILLSTEGWTSGVKEFTITLELVKQQ